MDELMTAIEEMRKSRGWDKSDNLPILIKSVAVEAGELLELIQWDEEKIDRQAVRGELADVLMYALTICTVEGWDPLEVVKTKIEDVYRRYPEVKNG